MDTPGAEVTSDFLETLDSLNLEPQDGYIDGETQKNTEQVKEETEPKTTEKTEETESETEQTLDQMFDFGTEDDSGEKTLDPEKAKFFNPKEVKVEAPIEQKIETEVKSEVSISDNVKTNLTWGINRLQEYLDSNYDYSTAKMMTQRDIDEGLRADAQEKEYKDRLALIDRKELAREEKARTDSMRPTSTSNLSEAVRNHGWGTNEKLRTALLHKDLGGPMLETMYSLANPGKKFSSAKEYAVALGDFYVKVTADKSTLTALEEYARARIYMRNKPALIDKIRNTKEKTDKQNKEANVSGNQARNRNEPGVKRKNAISDWLHNEGLQH